LRLADGRCAEEQSLTAALDELIFGLRTGAIGATGLRGASSPGNLYVSLHTADPGEQLPTEEEHYANYARIT
jgi:hypothetical protein